MTEFEYFTLCIVLLAALALVSCVVYAITDDRSGDTHNSTTHVYNYSGSEDSVYHDENTLFKVRDALQEAIDLEVNNEIVAATPDDLINAMQNRGILFRERTPDE